MSYRSLEEAVTQVDLVVRGRITDFWLAELSVVEGDDEGIQYVRATITIDEVLHGAPRSRSDGTVELVLVLWDPSEWPTVAANVPTHESLFFLLNTGENLKRLGFPPDEQRQYRFDHIPPNDQWVVRNIDGVVAGFEPGSRRFPSNLDGTPFRDVLRDARRAASSAR